MSDTLPRTLSPDARNILKAMDQFLEPASTNDIRAELIEQGFEIPKNFSIRLNDMAKKSRLLKAKKKGNRNVYSMAERGKLALENLDKINESSIPSLTSGRPEKPLKGKPGPKPGSKRGRPRKSELQVAPPQPEINVSATADKLADNVSALIGENAQYRELLLRIHSLIEKSLGLNKQPEQ